MQTTRRSFFQWVAGLLTGAAAAPAVAKAVVETGEADFRTPFDTGNEGLTAMQRALLESKAREVMIGGERACGKTHALMRWMAQKVKDSEHGYRLGATWIPSPNTFRGLVLAERNQCEYASAMLIESLNRLNVGCKFDRMVGGVRTPSGARVFFGRPEDLQRFRGYLLGAAAIDIDEPVDDNDYMTLLYALRHPGGHAITKVDYENRTITMSDIPEKKCQVAMTREAAPNRGALGASGDVEIISSENLGFAMIYGPVDGSCGGDTGLGNGRDGFNCCRTDHFTTDGFTPETFIDLADKNWIAHKRARSVQFP